MDWLYEKSIEPGGGKASSGGSSYHLSFRSGSRGIGSCAVASYEYITREGEYADGDRDPAIYTESDHVPSWAENDASGYWDAADLYERANGRLYVSADFALPRDLGLEEQVALAHEFAQQLTADESLPYTLVIHAGRSSDGHEHKAKHTMTDLRRSYDLLMMKVLTLLQNDDQKLASDIVSSREAIWRLLANPKTFATLQG